LILAIAITGTFGLRAAENAEAQRLLAEAKAKQTSAQQLLATAATALQRAADDQMEAAAQERDSHILAARALKLMGADADKQKAFNLRNQGHKLALEAHNMLVTARNDEQRAAQLTKNAEELRKAAAELKDQPATAATLENEAKEDETKAQSESQAAGQAKFGAQSLEKSAKDKWAEAEKLDPETHRQLAPTTPRPTVAEPREVK
jgi:hypothetical protein